MQMSDTGSDGKRSFLSEFKRIWNENKGLMLSCIWFWGVGFAPFMLIVIFRGWDGTFRSGEAYLYLIGVTVAVLGEVGIELIANGTKDLKELPKKAKAGSIFYLALSLAVSAWGVVLIVTQPRIQHPTTSWVQVSVFFIALAYLAAVRFTSQGIFNRFYRSTNRNTGQTPHLTAPAPQQPEEQAVGNSPSGQMPDEQTPI
jgi:hypothetical protein